MQPLVKIFRTPLGDTVLSRIDADGEHVTLETKPHGATLAIVELELAPEPTGLDAYTRYKP